MKPKLKLVKRHRVLVGGKPAFIVYDFHEKGTVALSGQDLAEYAGAIPAQNLIARTLECRNRVAESMVSDFKGFGPLFFEEEMEVQPYQIEVAEQE